VLRVVVSWTGTQRGVKLSKRNTVMIVAWARLDPETGKPDAARLGEVLRKSFHKSEATARRTFDIDHHFAVKHCLRIVNIRPRREGEKEHPGFIERDE
jgi:hypothetical protein